MMLLQEPEILLLDEPVAGMTDKETDKTGELLNQIARNRTIVVVEHDMEFVRNFASKVTVMHEGKLLKEGSMEEVQRDDRVAEVYLGRKGGITMLAVQQLEAGYGESVILRDVTMRVEPGQVVCLMGRNGVGKTTLIKSIMGLLKARKGTVAYKGAEVTKAAPGAGRRSGIGYVPQGREIFAQLTVYENLRSVLRQSRIPIRKLRAIPAGSDRKFPCCRRCILAAEVI